MAALLLLNALFLPYRARFHDSVLYGLQVANQVEGGRFDDDLFLRFGSQDSYSIFSRAVAPLTAVLGLQTTFLLLYLVSNALYFWGLIRLVRALIPDPLIATLGLLGVAVSPLPLGGLSIFHVNENFFTPRLPANALVLFGLERMLAGRWLTAAVLLLASLLLHPLMGFAGLLVFVLWCLRRCSPRLRFPAVWLVVGGLPVLLVPSLGFRLFGHMDAAWRAEIWRCKPHLLGTEWAFGDWIRMVVSAGVPLLAWRLLPGEGRRSDFLAALAAVSLLGVAGILLVCYLPYSLPMQVQPFRWLWPAEALQPPLALLLARHWWPQARLWPRLWTVLLLGYVAGVTEFLVPLGWWQAFFGLILFLYLRTVLRRASSWGGHRLELTLVGTLAGTMVLQVVIYWATLFLARERLTAFLDLNEYLHLYPRVIPSGCCLLVGFAVVLLLGRAAGFGRAFEALAVGAVLVVQVGSGAVPLLPSVRGRVSHRYGDILFLRGYLGDRTRAASRTPTVYWPVSWPVGRVDLLWFDLGVNSYFSSQQLAGNVFSRRTALVGRERANRVAPFEIASARPGQDLLPAWQRQQAERMFGTDLEAAPPSAEDLLKLAADTDLDFVVVRQGFRGLYAASNGTWFIYDCRALRSRAARARPLPRTAEGDQTPGTPRAWSSAPLLPGSSPPGQPNQAVPPEAVRARFEFRTRLCDPDTDPRRPTAGMRANRLDPTSRQGGPGAECGRQVRPLSGPSALFPGFGTSTAPVSP